MCLLLYSCLCACAQGENLPPALGRKYKKKSALMIPAAPVSYTHLVFVQERQPQRLELYREMGFAPIGRFLQKNAEGASGLLLARHFFGDEILRRK